MTPFARSIRLLLLDIEGTVSPLAFVHEVMFPYARRHLGAFLREEWSRPVVQEALEQMARDAGAASLAEWLEARRGEAAVAVVEAEALRLMDADVKAQGLKLLQGLVWERGFATSELCSTLFEDVAPFLRRWCAVGHEARVYSSGSVQAQRLFFSHTVEGSLLGLFSGFYDTAVGSKKEASSYARIVADACVLPEACLFVSDVVAELDAARAAGLQTVLMLRPGNAAAPPHEHTTLETLNPLLPA